MWLSLPEEMMKKSSMHNSLRSNKEFIWKKIISSALIFKRKSKEENKYLDCSDLCNNSKTIKRDEWEKEKHFSNTKISIRHYVYFLKQEINFNKDLRRKCTCKIIIN